MSAANPNRLQPPSDFPELAEDLRPAKEGSSLFTGRSMLLGGFLAALIVFIVGAGLDWFVLYENESRTVAISVSDTLAAVIAGILVYRLMQYERDRRRFVRQRLEIIAEMNHHVRNALQVISLSAHHSYADKQQLEAVKESVNRIQWALKEILPKL
jgi:hypothetical protein